MTDTSDDAALRADMRIVLSHLATDEEMGEHEAIDPDDLDENAEFQREIL